MKEKIIPALRASDGFRGYLNPHRLYEASCAALTAARQTYRDSIPRRSVRWIGRFEVKRLKTKTRIEYFDPSGRQLRVNELLPRGWKFEVPNRNYRDGMSEWPYRKTVQAPMRRLDRPDAIWSVFHELGHVYTDQLIDGAFWKAYDRADAYWEYHSFPGFNRRQQHTISPVEIMQGTFYPNLKAVRLMPETYRELLLDRFRIKQAEEHFAWAWALRAKANMNRAGFQSAQRHLPAKVTKYVDHKLGTHLYLVKQSVGHSNL